MNGAKPAWKSTEFYFNVAGQIGVLWGAIHGFIPQPWASVISIGGIAVYTIARTVAKAIGDIQAARIVTGSGSGGDTATANVTVKAS